jgi:class 3 adenylate cyclase
VYSLTFREGILFVCVPGGPGSDHLLALLSRRDEVIRDLVRKRLPVLTHLAVLVADLQESVKICSELPPEEYFELVNQIWSAMEPIFRRYYGTYGKHAGDGMVYYFFPQPDCSYVMNGLVAAQEMRGAMRRISKEWQLRKAWSRELYLNTGLNEGQEWLGTFQTASHVEFTVLGDTINHAARLSDFARYGAVWATKNYMGKLTTEQRQRVEFGVRRTAEQGREVFVASTYASVGSLMDLSVGRHEKLKDIATVPITEIVEVAPES